MRLKTMIAGLVAAAFLAGCAGHEQRQPRDDVAGDARSPRARPSRPSTRRAASSRWRQRRRHPLPGRRRPRDAQPAAARRRRPGRGRLLQRHHRLDGLAERHAARRSTPSAAGRAPEGARPGGLAVATPQPRGDARLLRQQLWPRDLPHPRRLHPPTVVPPDFRTFASGLQRGARVAVTMTDAVAVTITETPAS